MKGSKGSVGRGKDSRPYEAHYFHPDRKEIEGRCPWSVQRLHDLYLSHKGKFVRYEVKMGNQDEVSVGKVKKLSQKGGKKNTVSIIKLKV
jgi:hypothetical protein